MGGVGARSGVSIAAFREDVACWRSEMEKMRPTAKKKQHAKREREMFEFMVVRGGRWYPERSPTERKV
jgi:hypothetical protein